MLVSLHGVSWQTACKISVDSSRRLLVVRFLGTVHANIYARSLLVYTLKSCGRLPEETRLLKGTPHSLVPVHKVTEGLSLYFTKLRNRAENILDRANRSDRSNIIEHVSSINSNDLYNVVTVTSKDL